jgi:hypothetical protein
MANRGSGPVLNQGNNPGGARWCDLPEHNRLECTKSRRQGRGECHGPAIRGTDSCKIHAGFKRDVARARGKATITAWSALGQAADGEGVNSSAAVLGMLQQSWMRAHLYGRLLHDQVVRDGTSEVAIVDGHSEDVSGLIGYRYGAAGKDGTIYAVSEEARALVALESAERDRVVKYAKVAHDMGISDRMINLAEKWGDVVVTRLVLIIEGLNLTPDQQALVPALVQAHLGTIELGSGQ